MGLYSASISSCASGELKSKQNEYQHEKEMRIEQYLISAAAGNDECRLKSAWPIANYANYAVLSASGSFAPRRVFDGTRTLCHSLLCFE